MAVKSLRAEYGGPAYSVARLSAGLAAAGSWVAIWAADGSADNAPELIGDSRMARLTGSIDRALAGFGRPDVVHDNGLWLPHNHRLARTCTADRIPRVVSVRGMLEPWAFRHKRWKKRIAWSLYQRSDLAAADLHHATGDTEAQSVASFGLGVPIRVIPNGVELPLEEDVRRQGGSASRVRTALFMGRLYPVKGLPMLIKAWAAVRPSGWLLQIVGPDEGGHRAALEKLVEACGLGHVISFAGPMSGDAKRRAFVDADIFVLSSHSESFGVAAAEALAHGLPVLATRTTPWQMLEERRCGWLAEPTVESIADALRKATAADHESLRAMGREGRRLVGDSFGWQSIVRQFIDTYEGLLRLRGSR